MIEVESIEQAPLHSPSEVVFKGPERKSGLNRDGANHVRVDEETKILSIFSTGDVGGALTLAAELTDLSQIRSLHLENLPNCPLKHVLTPGLITRFQMHALRELNITRCPHLGSPHTGVRDWMLTFTRVCISECGSLFIGTLLDMLLLLPDLEHLVVTDVTLEWHYITKRSYTFSDPSAHQGASSEMHASQRPAALSSARAQKTLAVAAQRCLTTCQLPRLKEVHIARATGASRFLALLLATCGTELSTLDVCDLYDQDDDDDVEEDNDDGGEAVEAALGDPDSSQSSAVHLDSVSSQAQEFNAMIEAFAQLPCAQSVEIVRLECTALDGIGIRALVQCPRVRVLAVSGCRRLRDRHVACIAHLKHLQELHVDSLTLVSLDLTLQVFLLIR